MLTQGRSRPATTASLGRWLWISYVIPALQPRPESQTCVARLYMIHIQSTCGRRTSMSSLALQPRPESQTYPYTPPQRGARRCVPLREWCNRRVAVYDVCHPCTPTPTGVSNISLNSNIRTPCAGNYKREPAWGSSCG